MPICDYCGATLPAEMSGKEAIFAMLSAGWEVRKRNGKWIAVCKDCVFKEKGYDNDELGG